MFLFLGENLADFFGDDSVCAAQQIEPLPRDFADQPDSKARAGKWLPHHELAFETEIPPKTASVVHDPQHEWADSEWLEARRTTGKLVLVP